ncbi:28S rRNA (cytosine-C(5))-methyltransferase-like isoform X2 [Phymastichus coffea]|uniref:28S rRNA (cytosine-C(5))-methyltransferase-like isoform X2 n=1 Tax=Phymastichus coffea TaxID=108790 RepID=UPI00273B988C|nr:28S rRNA (cytosine-C(5))-methyltransferase-like isoform X2 [Phymastichus coffea]
MAHLNILSKMIPPEKLSQEREKYIGNIITHNQQKILPYIYRISAKILDCVEIEKLDVETAINLLQLNHIGNGAKRLVGLVISNQDKIEYLLNKMKFLERYQSVDVHLIRILIAEMIWGKQKIKIGSIEPAIILYHEADLKETFLEAANIYNISNDMYYYPKLPVYVRINTLSISLEDSIKAFIKEGWNLLPRPDTYLDYVRIISYIRKSDFIRDFHISELLVFPTGTVFYEHPGYLKGKFLLQDKGSCLSSFLLNPKPGSVVLDICAAPGKTTNHLANIINNQGTIYAIDRHPDRYNQLCALMNLTNVTCVKPIFDDCTNVTINDVNYILVDVSSTYSGIFFRRDERDLDNQLAYYNHLSITEGEKVIADALKEVGNSYSLLDIKEMLWCQWVASGMNNNYPFKDKCIRTNPDLDKCLSYFIAVFERNFENLPPLYVHRINEFNEIIYEKDNSDDEITEIDFINQENQRPSQPVAAYPHHHQRNRNNFDVFMSHSFWLENDVFPIPPPPRPS